MSSLNGISSINMTHRDPTQPHVHYIHKSVSSNVRRLQEGLDRYLHHSEKEDLVTVLNDYHARRNVVDFVYNLKGILNTSEKRRTILPLLRTILPASDLDVFDHCLQSNSRYGQNSSTTLARGLRNKNQQSNFTYATSTLPSASSRRGPKNKHYVPAEGQHQDNGEYLQSPSHIGYQSLGRNKTMRSSNDVFRLSIPQPPANHGFGFSIRGGAEYGIGIYVSLVGDEGLAKKRGLQAGDLILEVNNISFRKITHEDAANIIRNARKLDLTICRVGRIPGSYSVHQSYIWMSPDGRPVSPPPELEIIGQARSGDPRRSGLKLLKSADERKINLFVDEDESLGLMIRGGREFGLGIYITGVDKHSVAHKAGLKVGDQILDINGQSFLDISHSEAVQVLKDSHHMILMIKDVGKLPYAKTTVDKTLWYNSDHLKRSQSNRELSNGYRETRGETGKKVFTRGMGSQLMLNSTVTHHWDMIQDQARHLLNRTEQETLRLHLEDYQRRFLRVDELVLSLSDLLNTNAKFSLMMEVRNLIHPRDLDQYNALVMKREVEMLNNRHRYPSHLSHDSYSSSNDYHTARQPVRMTFREHDFNVNPVLTSHESSPELYHHSNGYHQQEINILRNQETNPRVYSSSENIAPFKKPPRKKLLASHSNSFQSSSPNLERSNSDVRDQGQRLHNLQRSRSEEALLVAADVHNGMYSISKPVEELKAPTEGDSGVYINGSSASDSSSPSNRLADEQVQNVFAESKETDSKSSSSPSPSHSSQSTKMDDSSDDWIIWREKYGDIPFEPITVYKSQPTLGLAIEGGANTRQPLPRVISVQPGGSAYESGGIKVGHVILEVNGRCLVGMEHNSAARAIAEAFKNKTLDRMDLLVTASDTDVKSLLQKIKKS